MTRIRVIPPADATGALAEAYREVKTYMPHVGKLVQACSVWPAWVRISGHNMLATLEAGSLSRQDKELLAVATSRTGGCHY